MIIFLCNIILLFHTKLFILLLCSEGFKSCINAVFVGIRKYDVRNLKLTIWPQISCFVSTSDAGELQNLSATFRNCSKKLIHSYVYAKSERSACLKFVPIWIDLFSVSLNIIQLLNLLLVY